MSGDRNVDLMGLRPAIETISPEEGARREARAMRNVVSEQGQVMSAALENNHNLYHTNKKLRQDMKVLESRNASLAAEVKRLAAQLAAIPDAVDKAHLATENARLKEQNANLVREMTRYLEPDLDSAQRKEILRNLKREGEELKLSGLVPSEEWINRLLPGEREIECSHPEWIANPARDDERCSRCGFTRELRDRV